MPTLERALHIYLQLDRREQTNRQYRRVLTKLVKAIGPERDVRLISYEDLVDYVANLRSRGLAPTTIANHTACLKAFFHWCVERRYLEHSPADGIVRASARRTDRPRAVPPHELAAMLECARYLNPKWYALLLFLADTGCRVGGLVSLMRSHLDLEHHTALLVEKGGKAHQARFGEQTAAALERWLSLRPETGHDYVFTGSGPDYPPLSRQGVASIVTRLAKRTGASRTWTPHNIRHSVGHAYAKAGVPVTITARKLGHSDPAVTARFYYPEDDQYLDLVSQRLELAALKTEDELQPPAAKVTALEERRQSG